MPGGACRLSARALFTRGLSLWSLARKVDTRQQEGSAEVARPLEAFAGNSFSVTSQFSLSVLIKASHKFSPVSGKCRRKIYPLMRRATSHIAKVMEEFMAIFITCNHPRISKFLYIHAACPSESARRWPHVILQAEIQDDGVLPRCRACCAGYHS